MTTEYTYPDLADCVCCGCLEEMIRDSAMTDKAWTDYSYNPIDDTFKISFDADLSSGDKTLLDGIVADSIGKRITKYTTDYVAKLVFEQAEQQTQLPRIMAAVDNHATIVLALNNYNFDLTRQIIADLVAGGELLAEDETLIDSILPASKWE